MSHLINEYSALKAADRLPPPADEGDGNYKLSLVLQDPLYDIPNGVDEVIVTVDGLNALKAAKVAKRGALAVEEASIDELLADL